MYAVIKTGGKQYKAAPGDVLRVEHIDAEPGSSISLDQVLMIADGEKVSVGNPLVAGSKVQAEVLKHGRGDKIRVIKFRRRKNSRTTQGHRQNYTELKITDISV